MPLDDELRKAIRDSGQSLYAIAKGTGVHYGIIYRFTKGQRDIYLGTASKVADYLRLGLAEIKRHRKRE